MRDRLRVILRATIPEPRPAVSNCNNDAVLRVLRFHSGIASGVGGKAGRSPPRVLVCGLLRIRAGSHVFLRGRFALLADSAASCGVALSAIAFPGGAGS